MASTGVDTGAGSKRLCMELDTGEKQRRRRERESREAQIPVPTTQERREMPSEREELTNTTMSPGQHM